METQLVEIQDYLGKCPNCESEEFNILKRECPNCGYKLNHDYSSDLLSVFEKESEEKKSENNLDIVSKRIKVSLGQYESYEILLQNGHIFGIKYGFKGEKYLVKFTYALNIKEYDEIDFSTSKLSDEHIHHYKNFEIFIEILGIWKKVRVGYGERFFIRDSSLLKEFITKVVLSYLSKTSNENKIKHKIG